MGVVWAVFIAVAVVLAALSAVGLRRRGTQGPVFHLVGGHLLVLSVATGLYPLLLELVGPAVWAAGYIALVVVLTLVMTLAAVRRARSLRPEA